MWKREKIQEMPRCLKAALAENSRFARKTPLAMALLVTVCPVVASLSAADILPAKIGTAAKAKSTSITPTTAILAEYGFISAESAEYGKLRVTAYRMKDSTGALAAWEALRSAESKPCTAAPYCAQVPGKTLIFDDNYVLLFEATAPMVKGQLQALLAELPSKKETALPPLLTFIPRQNIVPNSAHYLLGPASLAQFAPELATTDPGFSQGAEGHVSTYRLGGSPVRLALFYYPTPEQARSHALQFKVAQAPDVLVKRSSVLVALVLGAANEKQADDLMARVQYEAKITWNEPPPPNQVKKIYSFFLSVVIICCLLAGIFVLAGLFFGAMRLYRRRYGNLDANEAMTTLHLN
jgi:hypothetical protein